MTEQTNNVKSPKLLRYILIGLVVAIAFSSYFATELGKPSCEESYEGNCTSYANDGFEITSEQRWGKFWSTLPVTAIITTLIAVVVRNAMNKDN